MNIGGKQIFAQLRFTIREVFRALNFLGELARRSACNG
ncbi:hypothetical protein RB2350 [Rhodopirellula baltica SH 1]|uniref:Uncharacterized protein n=1 Tax=Rhodopirellula baltica (strain DSM 10527 / NCIMB 13988 / SH1) TaxID=243090 RepID=Q7UVZ7_RHOBA|nr:hypothetical protein RB2350 [Rhodopirellula baltica SH 1]